MPDVSREDMWTLLLCTVRYSLGRRSYMPGEAMDLVRRHRRHLAEHEVQQIAREVRAWARCAQRWVWTLMRL